MGEAVDRVQRPGGGRVLSADPVGGRYRVKVRRTEAMCGFFSESISPPPKQCSYGRTSFRVLFLGFLSFGILLLGMTDGVWIDNLKPKEKPTRVWP
jgi:hypothetical protein